MNGRAELTSELISYINTTLNWEAFKTVQIQLNPASGLIVRLKIASGCVALFLIIRRQGAQFHLPQQPPPFGWIISSIIPRMQSEAPKSQQQASSFQVIMAIRDTSSPWVPAATKDFSLRYMKTHAASQAVWRPARALAQIGGRT